MTTLDELEAIRNRAEMFCGVLGASWDEEAQTDRRTLLRLLDAAREELRAEQVSHLKTRVRLTRIREAAGPFLEEWLRRDHLKPGPDIDDWLIGGSALTYGDLRRLAAALTRAQGESS
jgi:hypothetical protein